MPERTCVYWLYDAEGSLLYIGLTCGPRQRMLNHERDKEWWQRAASIRLEHFATREDAEEAEGAAIEACRPPFNAFGPHGLLVATARPRGRMAKSPIGSFGRAVVLMRQHAQLRRADLSEKTGITMSRLESIELGWGEHREKEQERIAAFFGTTREDLLELAKTDQAQYEAWEAQQRVAGR